MLYFYIVHLHNASPRRRFMYQKFIENVLYIISIIFLGGSIYAYIFVNDDFTWLSLFGTDGLTFSD